MNYIQILLLFISFLAVVSISFFLYKGWLNSALLSRVTKAQTYSLMRIFLYAASVLALTAIIAYAYIIAMQHSRPALMQSPPKKAIDINGIWAIKSTTKPTKYPIAYLTINSNLPTTLWKNHWLQTINNLKIDNSGISFDNLNRPKGSLIPYTGFFDGEKLRLKRFINGVIEELIGTRDFDLTKNHRDSKESTTYRKLYQLHSNKNGVYSLAFLSHCMPLPSGGFILSAGSRGNFSIKSWDTATAKPLSALSTFDDPNDYNMHFPTFFNRKIFQDKRNASLANSKQKCYDPGYNQIERFNIISEDTRSGSFFISRFTFDIFENVYRREIDATIYSVDKSYPNDNKKVYASGSTRYITLDRNNSIINIRYLGSSRIILSITSITNVKTLSVNNDTTMFAVVETRPPNELETSSKEYLHLFKINNNKQKVILEKAMPFKTEKLIFGPKDRLLAFIDTHNNHIILWDIKTHSIIFKIPTPLTPKTIIAFSNDGKLLASVSGRVVSFWDLNTGTLDHKINHGETISAIDFSVDGRLFATGSEKSGVITLWSK